MNCCYLVLNKYWIYLKIYQIKQWANTNIWKKITGFITNSDISDLSDISVEEPDSIELEKHFFLTTNRAYDINDNLKIGILMSGKI